MLPRISSLKGITSVSRSAVPRYYYFSSSSSLSSLSTASLSLACSLVSVLLREHRLKDEGQSLRLVHEVDEEVFMNFYRQVSIFIRGINRYYCSCHYLVIETVSFCSRNVVSRLRAIAGSRPGYPGRIEKEKREARSLTIN